MAICDYRNRFNLPAGRQVDGKNTDCKGELAIFARTH